MTSAIPFLIIMTIIVAVHEFGHFAVARRYRMRIDVFSVGFGREIAGRTDNHGTRWRLGWVPLGGYVKFAEPGAAETKPAIERHHDAPFRTKPVWQRSAVLAAGPAANFILAIALYAVVNMTIGASDVIPRIGTVVPGSPAARAGLEPGDTIIAIDGSSVRSQEDIVRLVGTNFGRALSIEIRHGGESLTQVVVPMSLQQHTTAASPIRWGDIGVRRPEPAIFGNVAIGEPAYRAGMKPGDHVIAIDGRAISSYDDLVQAVAARAGTALRMAVRRDGATLAIDVTPARYSQLDGAGQIVFRGRIGVSCAPVRLPPIAALTAAVDELLVRLRDGIADILQALVSPHSGADLAGPIAIAQVTGEVASLGIAPLIRWAAFLSLSIGLMNLLPIPVFDGGRLVLCTIEAVRRRPLTRTTEKILFRVGFAIVLVLLVYANVTDLIGVGRAWIAAAG